jgi:hypothetical protein
MGLIRVGGRGFGGGRDLVKVICMVFIFIFGSTGVLSGVVELSFVLFSLCWFLLVERFLVSHSEIYLTFLL